MSIRRLVAILVLVFIASSFVVPGLGKAQIRPHKKKTPTPLANKRKEVPVPKAARRNGPTITESKPVPSLKVFEFDTVTVDPTGSITNRRKGQAQYFTEDINGVGLEMVKIPSGIFLMGSPVGEARHSGDEGPQHQVSVQTFYMGKYEVTQAQWRAVANLPKVKRGLNPVPSQFKGDDLPVDTISWEEAVEFCKRLSRVTGRQYRLPSEAEWEYACRAGTTTPFAFGETITPELVNYYGKHPYGAASKGTSRGKTTPVGGLGIANAFGLYDMHGNVWEWCLDTLHKNYNGAPSDGRVWGGGDARYRVLRGGSFQANGHNCRSACRGWIEPDGGPFNRGFRIVFVARTR